MQKRSYLTLYPFPSDFFKYTDTEGLTPVGGSQCPKGRFLYENGRKLFPGVHTGVDTYMVGVYDPVSFINGFIDPNSKVFILMNTDKPYTSQILDNVNGIFGKNPNGNTESDKGPGVYTLANSAFGANVDISGNLNTQGNQGVGGNQTVYGNQGIGENVDISGNLRVYGTTTLQDVTVNNLTIHGNTTQIDLTDMSSEQFTITNNGTGPAFTVNQLGSQPIANFNQNSNSVLYLKEGGNIGVNTTSPNYKLEVNGTFNATTVYQGGNVLVPPGSLMMYIMNTAPAGWLLCDGRDVSRSTYAALFSVIGTTYGSGDNTNTFNLPDTRGRAVIGNGTGPTLTARSLGQSGGAETHTLDTTQIPSHSHTGTTVTSGSHSHTHNANAEMPGAGLVYRNSLTTRTTADNGQPNEINLDTAVALSIDSNGTHSHSFTTASIGGGNAHNNMQPFVVISYIIKY
jgi:microcystin-dependent protein